MAGKGERQLPRRVGIEYPEQNTLALADADGFAVSESLIRQGAQLVIDRPIVVRFASMLDHWIPVAARHKDLLIVFAGSLLGSTSRNPYWPE
jgi:hypothetical protein